MTRRRTVTRAVAVTALVTAMSSVGLSSPAHAHNRLIETDPAEEAELTEGPDAVTLTYDQEVGEQYNVVTVTGPEGGEWQDGDPEVQDETVRQDLRPLGPAGDYEASWRVVSADGHPVSGTFEFTLTTAGDGTPLPESEQSDGAGGEAAGGDEEAAADSSGWLPLAGVLVLGALVVVGLVVGASVVMRRRGSGAG